MNSLDRAQGWADSPLTDAGKQTAVDLGEKLKTVDFDVAYTSDMLRTMQTAELILKANAKPSTPIKIDVRLREWCLGNMEAEHNPVFIQNVAEWLGGIDSFTELNVRLPDVADAIFKHDTTGMAELFSTIENRLKSVFLDAVQKRKVEKDSNILVVTHAFAIKTIFYLFASEQLEKIGKVKNAAVSMLTFDGEDFFLNPDILQ